MGPFNCIAVCEVEAQFEGHIESRKLRHRVEFGAREVMNTEATFVDDPEDFKNAKFAGVIVFQRAPGLKAASLDREDHCAQERLVDRVERAIEEDVATKASR